jgi:hypothetical protein
VFFERATPMRATKNGVTVGIERFEPDRCKADLAAAGIDTDRWVSGDQSINYRQLNRARAEVMSADMRRGVWDLNGETIKYDEDGKLQDGQHRFLASVLSGCSFDSAVAYGVRRISNVDTGGPRRLANELHHRKVPQPNKVAAVVKLVAAHECGQLLTAVRQSWGTRSMLLDCFEKNERIVDFVRATTGCRQQGFVAAVAFIGGCGELYDLPRYFIEGLISGKDLSSDDPVFVLREKLIDEGKSRQGQSARVPLFARIVKAWNLLVSGSPATVDGLRFRAVGPAREPFPEISRISSAEWNCDRVRDSVPSA